MDIKNEVRDQKMWKTVKNLTSNNKQTPPRAISHGGQLIPSIKKNLQYS